MEMSIFEYLEEMKRMQVSLLEFLENEDDNDIKYQGLTRIFDDIKIYDNQFKIRSLFHMILKISNNHHRNFDFFDKIDQILQLFKDDIPKYFSNYELFNIFKSNKRLLLILLEENILIFDELIVKKIINNEKYKNANYPQYFQPEIQPFINEKWFSINIKKDNSDSYYNYDDNEWKKEKNTLVDDLKKNLPEDFYENRRIGENDNEICRLIQKDSIEEFIVYINKNNYPIKSNINSSIYETNNFLLKNKNISLIEYAAFLGSIQIFNYLKQNGAKLRYIIWICAIHSQNAEIINLLEEDKKFSNKKDTLFKRLFKESIKCHHNDVSNYIQNNYLGNEDENSNDILINGLKYHNFMFIQSNIDHETLFYYSCKYDYFLLVFILLEETDIDLNKRIIYIVIFLIQFNIILFNKIQNYFF